MGSRLVAVLARGAVSLRSCSRGRGVRRRVSQAGFRPLLIVLSLGVVGVAPAIGAGAQHSSSSGTLSVTDLTVDAQVKRDNARLQRWRSPEARAARKRSRTAHRGLSAAGALDAAQAAFPMEFKASLFNGSRPDPGVKVVKRLPGGAAVTQNAAGDKSVLQSSLPLETQNGAGEEAPVDLGLITDTKGFRTRNALVDLTVGKRSSAGFELPTVDVSIAPGGSDAPATESDDRVFFANTQTDADFMVMPRPDGAAVGWHLRSADSPEQLTLDVDVPAGAVLRRARTDHPIPGDPPRSFEIAKGGVALAYISPPNTYDADGVPVPSDARLQGEKIIVSVDHRAGDYHYPLFVDPIVSANDTDGSSWAGWTTTSSGGSFGAAVNNPAYNNGGPYLSMPTNTTYSGSGAFIWWQYQAISKTYIYAGTLGGMAHSPSMPYQAYGATYRTYPWVFSRWFNGLQDGAFTGWEANTDYINQSGAYGGNPFGPSWNAAGGVTHAFCLKAQGGRPRCDRENLPASDENAMILGLAAQNNVNGGAFSTMASPATVTMAWANVYLNDRYAPSIPQPPDKGWTDDGGAMHQLPVTAHDQGLGMDTIELSGDGITTHPLRAATCYGHPQRSPCPTAAGFSPVFFYQLNEGINTLHLLPKDIVDNYGAMRTWKERIDRTPPAIGLSGSLASASGTTLTASQSYVLDINATDAGSGVKDLTILFDGDEEWTSSQTCGEDGGCSLPHTYTLSSDGLSAGEHTITVQAQDILGHPSEKTIVISAPGSPPPDDDSGAPDESVTSPASPPPVSPTGPVPAGSYSTSLWSDAETNTTDGVNVVSSTAPDTIALTGTVINEATQDVVSGASVQLSCAACGPTSITTTTDAKGAYAFINMPEGTYRLAVAAAGHEPYQVIKDSYEPGDTYYHQAAVSTVSVRTIDASIKADPNNYINYVSATSNGYPSVARVPPTIRVGIVPRDSRCNRTSDPPNAPVRKYAWAFYVLRMLTPEVGGLGYNEAAMKAFEGFVSNYAWYHTIKPYTDRYDLDNSTSFQCFEPDAKVKSSWREWLGDVLKYRFVNDNPGPGQPAIIETRYIDGDANGLCNDPVFPRDQNRAGQHNIGTLSRSCGPEFTDWKGIVNYVIGGNIRPTDPPPTPTVSGRSTDGGVHLEFKSGSSRNLSWRYEIQRLGTTGMWVTVYRRGWEKVIRDVRTEVTYHTPLTQRYRIRAWSPAGFSRYANVNGTSTIAPG